ncbi:hypothetical protein GIB67_010046 [Kingdonia uniflora]|uniref:Uncharacterized protein n=1 Tax=Kingdonia uniflora TaxID=39325 RepID=A0A7J7KV90_9MAGN|nr:hypothetical protein GIB67_010046 [Kingdonia uniflora]
MGNNDGNDQEDLKRDQQLTFNLKWRDLLDPDSENLLAVGLTGLFAWATVQVLWQLFFISVEYLLLLSSTLSLLLFFFSYSVRTKKPNRNWTNRFDYLCGRFDFDSLLS